VAGVFADSGLTNGSYSLGARSSPTSMADSGSVSLLTGLLKYVSAAVWMP
jgi:hypothetical protein